VSEAGLQRDFSSDFFFVPVGGGGAFRNFAEARGGSGGEK